MAPNRLPLTSLFRGKAVRTAIPSEVVPTSSISVGPNLKRGGSYIDARVVHNSVEREKVRAWRLVTSNNRQCSTTRCLALDHVEAGGISTCSGTKSYMSRCRPGSRVAISNLTSNAGAPRNVTAIRGCRALLPVNMPARQSRIQSTTSVGHIGREILYPEPRPKGGKGKKKKRSCSPDQHSTALSQPCGRVSKRVRVRMNVANIWRDGRDRSG